MFVCCECCVLSGRGICDELITRPEESYQLCCVIVCDLETSRMRRPWPSLGRSATGKKKTLSWQWWRKINLNINKQINIALVVVDQLITTSMKRFIFFAVCFSHFYKNLCIFLFGAATQRGSWPPHSWGFPDHKQRRTAVGRTPLDEWSARRRDLYLATHNTHNRQTSIPQGGFEPTIPAGERSQTYALDRLFM